jgi:hypothetical protein
MITPLQICKPLYKLLQIAIIKNPNLMTTYKYTLDKSSKKFNCPNCNQKRFVKYIDIETNQYLDSGFGRCDRTENCGYFKMPTKSNDLTFVNFIKHVPAQEIKPLTYHPLEQLQKHTIDKPMCDNLSQFLLTIFSHKQVQELKTKYLLSGTNYHWNNATMFWQIDETEQIHACKIMQYNALTGKRIKKPYNHVNWLHKALKLDDFVLRQCLFGLHRINENPIKTIAIVESEKTALIMSLYVPDYIWIATGSKANLKFNLLLPLKHRNIMLFPDKGCYNDWFDKATELNRQYFKINVSDLIENTDHENGFDLADLYLLN